MSVSLTQASRTFSQVLFYAATSNKLIGLKPFLSVTKLMPISDLTVTHRVASKRSWQPPVLSIWNGKKVQHRQAG